MSSSRPYKVVVFRVPDHMPTGAVAYTVSTHSTYESACAKAVSRYPSSVSAVQGPGVIDGRVLVASGGGGIYVTGSCKKV